MLQKFRFFLLLLAPGLSHFKEEYPQQKIAAFFYAAIFYNKCLNICICSSGFGNTNAVCSAATTH